MKRRIISTVLVVVMLALTLVGCGYNFTKKDMAENAKFVDGMSKEAFKAALMSLSVVDADFGNLSKTEQRAEKVNDYIYKILEGAVKTTDATLQLTEGEFDANDIIVYTYFATYSYEKTETVDGSENTTTVTEIIYPSKTSSTVTIKLGYSNGTLTAESPAIRDAIIAALGNGANFETYKYDYKGNIVEYIGDKTDVSVYVTYTKTENVTKGEGEAATTTAETTTVKYDKVVLDPSSTDFIVKTLLATEKKDEKDVGKYSFNTKITDALVDDKGTVYDAENPEYADLTDDEKAAKKAELEKDDVKYTDITVHFAYDNTPNTVIKAEYTVTSDIKTDDFVGYTDTKLEIKKDAKIVYNVYPLYYFDVEDLTAENVLTTDGLTKELLADSKLDEALKAASEKAEGEEKSLLEKFTAALEAFEKAEDELEKAEDALNKETTGAKAKYEEAVKKAIEEEKAKVEDQAAKDAITAESDVVKNNSLVVAAKKVLDDAQAAYDKANETLNGKAAEGENAAVPGAKADYETASANLFNKLGDDNNAETTDDATKGMTKVVDAYKESVKDMLIDAYEDAMTTNIGQALWTLMKDSVDVFEVPEKSVKEAYERIYEGHEYTFYTGSHSSSGLSNYKYYSDKGGFKQYLIEKTVGTGKGDFDDAKAYIMDEAKAYVEEIVVIYYIAEIMDLELDKDEIKAATGTGAAKKDMEKTYGKTNILAAAQFNKLFDYFLEVEMTEKDGTEEVKKDENGAKIYKNVKVTTWTEKKTDK